VQREVTKIILSLDETELIVGQLTLLENDIHFWSLTFPAYKPPSEVPIKYLSPDLTMPVIWVSDKPEFFCTKPLPSSLEMNKPDSVPIRRLLPSLKIKVIGYGN